MFWYDPSKAFARRFEPTEGGYLFYPRAKGPGKLVTPAEYEALAAHYRRWMGGRFKPGLLFAILFGAILMTTIVSVALGLPPERDNWLIYPLVALLVGFIFWLQFAPHRLVKGRPDAAPPRTKAQLGRATRRVLTWPQVVLGIAVSGLFAAAGLAGRPSIGVVVWTVFWALVFATWVKLAFQKFQDSRV
jgi:4-hydroxybenzoate polyprenyltransferase